MNALGGTKFKIVVGYPGTTGAVLAMEWGEVQGAYGTIENLLAIPQGVGLCALAIRLDLPWCAT